MRSHQSDRCWIDVDLAALVRNAEMLARHARSPLLPMVKADAYGLGAVPVARALEAIDPWGYGVATIGEGEELRAAGITRRVLVTCPPEPGPRPLQAIRAAGLIPALGDATAIRMWMMLGGGDWHLSVDTGMNRTGVRFDRIGELAEELAGCPPTAAFTHFCSSECDDGSVDVQTQRFRDAVAAMPARPPLLHTDNSAAIVRAGRSEWGILRPGVFLYGVGSGAPIRPEPVASFRAIVVDMHDLNAGDSVSYNGTWTAPEPRRIATLAAGYADGYRRLLGNKGTILVNGHRVPVVGTVTMDLTMVDVTGLHCERGDVATLIGTDGDQLITVEQVAAACGLSPYEILTGLRARARRVYA